jgi:hypothetical protein
MATKLAMLVLLAAASAAKGDLRPPVGSYGFDWGDPDGHCAKLDAKAIARFKRCHVEENAFGLPRRALACRVDANVEYIVYPTAAQCQEGLETMQANGD